MIVWTYPEYIQIYTKDIVFAFLYIRVQCASVSNGHYYAFNFLHVVRPPIWSIINSLLKVLGLSRHMDERPVGISIYIEYKIKNTLLILQEIDISFIQ